MRDEGTLDAVRVFLKGISEVEEWPESASSESGGFVGNMSSTDGVEDEALAEGAFDKTEDSGSRRPASWVVVSVLTGKYASSAKTPELAVFLMSLSFRSDRSVCSATAVIGTAFEGIAGCGTFSTGRVVGVAGAEWMLTSSLGIENGRDPSSNAPSTQRFPRIARNSSSSSCCCILRLSAFAITGADDVLTPEVLGA